jgi:hypothetical protein
MITIAAASVAVVTAFIPAVMPVTAAAPAHNGPYTYMARVRVPARGDAYDRVTYAGRMCWGATRNATLWLSAEGKFAEKAAAGAVHGRQVSFRLAFSRQDAGRWVLSGITMGCAAGGTMITGRPFPVITVTR